MDKQFKQSKIAKQVAKSEIHCDLHKLSQMALMTQRNAEIEKTKKKLLKLKIFNLLLILPYFLHLLSNLFLFLLYTYHSEHFLCKKYNKVLK